MCEQICRQMRKVGFELYVLQHVCELYFRVLTAAGFCQLATGTFLQQVAQCHGDSCEDGVNISVLLTILGPVCRLAGLPIPADAISSAQAVTPVVTPTTVITKVVTTTAVGLVTIWQTSTSTPTCTTATILTEATNKDGLVQTFQVPECYNSDTTIYGNPVLISNAVETAFSTTTVEVPPTSATLATTTKVVTVTSVQASSVTVFPLSPASTSSTDTAVVIATAALTSTSTSVNGSPFSSQGDALGTAKISRWLALGLGLAVGLLLIQA